MARKNPERTRQPGPVSPQRRSGATENPVEALWAVSRSGARAGRGFHYQAAVGAWLCGRVLGGVLAVDRLVPEGLEDFSCDGPEPWYVQVKSRQERIGDFTFPEVADHLLAMARADAERRGAGLGGRSVLVLERPVKGEWFTHWGRPLSELPADHPLLRSLWSKAAKVGLTDTEIATWCTTAGLYVLPWRAAAEEPRAVVAQRHGLLPAAAEAVVLALRAAVWTAADANAETSLTAAEGLDRTRIERIVTDTADTVDRASLEEALATGCCEPVDFDRPLPSAGFHEGVDVQPGHIVAGLPAPRPLLAGRIADAIGRGRSVLVTGPSGVGKSTVMWTAAYTMRHVLWYRVRRLRPEDAAPLVRLAKALRPALHAPVGFVVDGIGIGAAESWDTLHRELAPLPGVVLLGSVRSEDLLPLRSRADCVQVPVGLDEEVAGQIHANLSASGATSAPHWREAYEAANGLTLEFTHLLTRGRRLSDVLREQVERRVVEGRQAELEILARISVAHRWGVDLPVRALQRQLGLADLELRVALSRLADEHLVHESMGRLSGLHQLRSARLVDAVHALPPPVLDETVTAVLELLTDAQLQPFVAGVLVECPELDAVVMRRIVVELDRRSGLEATVSVLQALRLIDITRCATGWAEVLDRHRVPPALRRTTLQVGLVGGPPLPNLRPEIASALAELRVDDPAGSPLRDALAERLGAASVERLLGACANPSDAVRLLAVLAGTGLGLAEETGALAGTRFARLLATMPLAPLGDVLSTARTVSVPLARELSTLAGGPGRVLGAVTADSPWAVEAAVVEQDGKQVARVRLLHVDDLLRPEAEQEVREIARTLLRCLPTCESVDVQNVLAGGVPLTIGDFTAGISRLNREYYHPPAQIASLRTRALVGALACGSTDWTTRAAEAAGVLPVLQRYLSDLTRLWCIGRPDPGAVDELRATRTALLDWAARATLPVDVSFLAALPADAEVPGGGTDHLQQLVHGITENLTARIVVPEEHRRLVGYVGEDLKGLVTRVRDTERWHLLDQEPPYALEQLAALCTDLHAVLAELAWGTIGGAALTAAARSGPAGQALARAADLARRAAAARAAAAPLELQAGAAAAGLRIVAHTRPCADPGSTEWPAVETAVAVDLDDLSQWESALELLCAMLTRDSGSEGSRGAVLLLPQIAGRPVRRATRQLVTTLWPGAELFDTWKDVFPEAHPTPLTDAVLDAHGALQSLSGLVHLAALRETDARHQAFADRAAERFRRARRTITELGGDDPVVGAVTEVLDALARRVENEADGSHENGSVPCFAAAIALGSTGTATEEHFQFNGLLAVALHWDLDPGSAARLLVADSGP